MFYFTLLKVELYGCFRVFLENFIFKLYSYKSYERSSNNQLMHCFRWAIFWIEVYLRWHGHFVFCPGFRCPVYLGKENDTGEQRE